MVRQAHHERITKLSLAVVPAGMTALSKKLDRSSLSCSGRTVQTLNLVRRVNRRAWLAAQTLCPNTTENVHARRNPPNVTVFAMLDYDVWKAITYLKNKGFCASRQLLLHCQATGMW
jgi:hypothetical protein